MRRIASWEIVREDNTGPELSIQIDSASLAERIEQMTYHAAELELITERNREDVEATWGNFFTAIDYAGTLHIELNADARGWVLEGRLTPERAR